MNGVLNIKTESNFEIAEKVITLKDELKQLEDEYNEKYTRRSNEINEIISIELRCESLMRRNEELKDKLVEVVKERDQAVEKLDELKKSHTQLESNVRQANSEMTERETTCENVKKRENELNEEVNALKQTNLTLGASLNDEKKKSQKVFDLLTNLKKQAQEQQEKFDLKSFRQQKFINDLKANCTCNKSSADSLRLLRAEIEAEKTLNATQQKILDDEKREKEQLKAKMREYEEKLLLIQMNVVQNRAIYDAKQADMIKKLEAEKRAKLAIEQDLNESREANLRMAANNQLLKEKIGSVSRLEERIDHLEEKRKKTQHENNKVLEEISRLTSKRIANLHKMRETIEDNHTRNKRKSSDCEVVSEIKTVKSKKASN